MKYGWFLVFALVHGHLFGQQPGDLNEDGLVTDADGLLLSQTLLSGATPPSGSDCNLDGTVDYLDVICVLNQRTGMLVASSPAHLETGVAVTRETRLLFSLPLDPASVAGGVQVVAAGETPTTTTHLSPDGKTLIIFYPDLLPEGAVISLTLDGNQLRTAHGIAVDVDGDGSPGGAATIEFETLALDLVAGTAVVGRVFAGEQVASQSGFLDVGLAGVSITVDGAADSLFTTTDALGNFRLDPAPAGRFFVHIDGRTATGVPVGDYYPFVGKAWEAVPGREANVGNIFLPLIREGTLQPVSATEETEISFPPEVLADNPRLIGTRLMVPADALFADDGSRGGMVGIAPVDPERLPGTLPTTLSLPLVITVQTDGPTNFDRPVPVCFPNLPDPETGALALPGEASALVSFNHDTGRFEVVGAMTVSADGNLVCSDPGVGIQAPGWHGTRRGTSGGGGKNRGGGEDDDNGEENEDDQDDEDREEKEEKGPQDPPPAAPPNAGANSPEEEECPQEEEEEDAEDPVDPVYLFSGEFYHTEEDLRIPGRGFDFVWTRKYRAQLAVDSAMGRSWDYSYNIKLKRARCGNLDPSLCPLILYDGNTRRDRYRVGLDGSYDRDEFFRTIVVNPDDSLTLTFANQGVWTFLPLDGHPAQGKISSIRDRNGNTMTFAYDGLGRLSTITDTLDRDITIGYNGSGTLARIATVTDFSGRVLRYEHYDGGTAGGRNGDLKSFTGPAVTGTPNGNDFPNGKTVSYTYQKEASGVPFRLWGNLLTITDGRRNDPNDATFGQGPWLVNTYDRADRLVHQEWGGDIVDVYYNRIFPSRANGMAVKQTIVNDRKGHIKEYWWDQRNRCVLERMYTGRADPIQPTTFFSNLPTGKLRSEDPDYFETRYFWNMDSLKSKVIHPNGNITEYLYERDLNPDGPARSRGNLRIVRHLPGPLGGDQPVIEESYTYATGFGSGGCCGYNFVAAHTDGRGNTSTFTYDDKGNLINKTERIGSIQTDWQYNSYGQVTLRVMPDNGGGHRRSDVFSYYTSGHQKGYLEKTIIDSANLALTTTIEYDPVGNPIRVINPNGHDTLFVYNQLNQVQRIYSRETAPGSGIRYERDYAYDANNNLVRLDVQNVDDQGVLGANPYFTTTYEYEILNHPIRRTREVGDGHEVVEEYHYDPNRNLNLIRFGEAVNGNQPNNTVALSFDERDLLYRLTGAPGDAVQTTNQFDYDGNQNLAVVLSGLEETPRRTSYIYDGYDRSVGRVDAMGNRYAQSYDANNNPVTTQNWGELLDVAGDAGNRLLSEERFTYDPMNRLTRLDRSFFETETGANIDDGQASTSFTYSDLSQILNIVDDNNNQFAKDYDTANRLMSMTDQLGNIIELAYNANSDVILETKVEKNDLGGPDQIFQTNFEYDPLQRLIKRVDDLDNTHEYAYDSRSNLTRWLDAQRGSDPGNPGNLTSFVFDGLNRLIRTTKTLTDDGAGTGTPIGTINNLRHWDDSNRLIGMADDNGNLMTYRFDAVNRKNQTEYADGSTHTRTFDVHHNTETIEDANGTMVNIQHDLLNRLISKNISVGPGVSAQTTFEAFGYDGLSRLRSAENNDTLVTFSYDSLSRPRQETLNGQAVLRSFDGLGNVTESRYPGGRQLQTTYDGLNRISQISEAGSALAQYAYVGPERVSRLVLGNHTQTDFLHDEIRRVREIVHVQDPSNAIKVIDHRQFAWDGMHNKILSRDLLRGEERTFSYDAQYRLTSAVAPGGTVSYTFDGPGNRLEQSGGPLSGAYEMSSIDPDDLAMNQYTRTPFDSRVYDRSGNLVSTHQMEWVYDYANRPVHVQDFSSGQEHLYRYDALGRRFEKVRDATGNPEIIRFFYSGRQVIEEQDAMGQTTATYVYGRYIDEILSMERGGNKFFYHTDDLYNVVKLTDETGAVIESYAYGDYGRPSLFDAKGVPISVSSVANPYLFNGRRYDPETGLYYYRSRYLDPLAGRFTTRDVIGIWGDPVNLGNGYTFVGNNPYSRLDPLGLYCSCNPIMDDPRIREAFKEASKLTKETGKEHGFEIFEDSKCEFTCGDAQGYRPGPITTTGDLTWDPPNSPDMVGTAHGHLSSADPSSYNVPGGDVSHADGHRQVDVEHTFWIPWFDYTSKEWEHRDEWENEGFVIGPDGGKTWVVPYGEKSRGGYSELSKLDEPCSPAEWKEKCCGQ